MSDDTLLPGAVQLLRVRLGGVHRVKEVAGQGGRLREARQLRQARGEHVYARRLGERVHIRVALKWERRVGVRSRS